MTKEQDSDPDNDISAEDIASRLREAVDTRLLSRHQNSLLCDTLGLLEAVHYGVLRGSSRIFTNLVTIVDQFEENEQTVPSINACQAAIFRAAELGLSEGHDANGQRQVRWTRSTKK